METLRQQSTTDRGVSRLVQEAFRRVRNPSSLMRVGLVLGAVAAFCLVGILAAKLGPIYVAILGGLPFALAGVQFLFRRPHLLPVTILVVATATMWYFSAGITPALVLTAAFAALWVLEMVLDRRIRLIGSPAMAPALGTMLVAVASLIWGKVMADPLLKEWPRGGGRGTAFGLIQLAQLAVLVLSPAALILTANMLTCRRHLKVLVYTYIAVTSVGVIAEALTLPFRLNMWGLTSMWATCLIYGQLVYNRKQPRWLVPVLIGVLGVWFYLRLYRGITWKSGWLPGVAAIAVVTFLRSRRASFVLLLVAIVVVAASWTWWGSVWSAEYAESTGNRLDKWIFLFGHHVTLGHWFLGTGPFGYAQYFMTFFPNRAASTHSNYIDLLLQLGVVGSALYAWLIGVIAWTGYRLYRKPVEDQFVQGFVASVLGGLVGLLGAMFLGDWFTPFVLNQGLHGYSWTVSSWILLGALAAVPSILRHEQQRSEAC